MGGIYGWVPNTTSVAVWAMMIACLLPILFAGTAKILGGFSAADNAHPRDVLSGYTGKAARANAAQQNSFESLPIFLAAVLTAMWFFVPQMVINNLAVLYLLMRLGYGIAYIVNLPLLRSILWFLSLTCCFMLFYLSIQMGV